MDSTGHAIEVPKYDTGQPMPKGYRQMSEDDLALVNEIKEHGEAIRDLIDRCDVHSHAGPDAKRWVSIARTHFQQGYMALCRSVTRPGTFA